METMKELVAVQKPIMLDGGNFGHWKARMRHIIRGIDEDAWTAVEEGWSAPTVIMDDKSVALKPKNRWTDSEKAASKFNSKALTAIFSAVDLDQFKIIQGCESAKEAWDTLVNHFEGNTSVRRTRIDHLASRFENLRMGDDEPIDEFISKISELSNESSVLGKKYEEKDLVKKLLRCLPPRFEAYKAVLDIAVNTDEMKFDQLSGILKVHDLQKTERLANTQKSIAFSAETKEDDRVAKIEETLGLMARNFKKFVKRMEKGGSRSTGHYHKSESDHANSQSVRRELSKNSKRKELQCHECEGYGHFRNECPLTKRKELKCIECKGYGHTRSECPNNLKKDKSLVSFSDTESESDSDGCEPLLNFVALVGREETEITLSEDEEEDCDLHQDLKTEYKSLFDKFAELSVENVQLLKDKAMLKAQVNILELEQSITCESKESDVESSARKRDLAERERNQNQLEVQFRQLNDLLAQEMEKRKLLESQLNEKDKKLRMLNKGTADLDHILSIGQSPRVNFGLGYLGGTTNSVETGAQIVFVKETPSRSTNVRVDATERSAEAKGKVLVRNHNNGCRFCGKRGHNVRFCYSRKRKYERA